MELLSPTTLCTRPPARRPTGPVTAVAVVVGCLIVAASLLRHDGDIAGLIKFGDTEAVAERTAHVEDVLGREVSTVGLLGHDGSQFFLQALDPFYRQPEEHAVHLDRPAYRAQRMLYPTLVGLGGLLPPEMILWSMAVTNVAAIAAGTAGTARLAQRFGGTPWLGLGFALNPGIIFEFDIAGAGILAFACAIWGTNALIEDRYRAAVGWFVAAVLAREVMLLYLAGVCCHRLWSTRRVPWLLGGAPALCTMLWGGYLRLRLDTLDGEAAVQEFGLPFAGAFEALAKWGNDPVQLALVASVVALMPPLITYAWRRPNPLAWGAVGFVPLALVMNELVWWNASDIARVVAPIVTAYVVTAFSEPLRTPDDAASLS
ncbi:MAG: hypothetical protein AAGC53_13090 [Actinomycetota bacterium]